MWRLRIEQYIKYKDECFIWDVIENGNSFKPVAQTTTNADGTSTSLIPGLVPTEEKVQKKNHVKTRRSFFTPNLDSPLCLEEFQQPKFEGYGPKTSKSVSEDISNGVLRTS
ncbi:hypothetical protein Tco_0889842 [Tanacetum coccineum]